MQNEKVNKGKKREEAKRKHRDHGSGSQAPVWSGCAPALHEHRPRKKEQDGSTGEGRRKRTGACIAFMATIGNTKGDQSRDGHLSETDRMSDELMTTLGAGLAEMLCRPLALAWDASENKLCITAVRKK